MPESPKDSWIRPLRHLLRWVALGALGVFLALGLLTILGRDGFPRKWCDAVAERLSGEGVLVRIGGIRLTPMGGLVVKNLTLSEAGRREPFAQVDRVRIRLRPASRLWSMVRSIEGRNLVLRRVPEIDASGGDCLADVVLPRLAGVRLSLRQVDVLGIRADGVDGVLAMGGKGLHARDVQVWWARRLSEAPWLKEEAYPLWARPGEKVSGWCSVDLASGLLVSELEGATRPDRLWALFPLLKLKMVEDYCRDFAFGAGVLASASCRLELGISAQNNRTVVDLPIAATNLSFRGVALNRLSGRVRVDGRETVLSGVRAESGEGMLSGKLWTSSRTHRLAFDAETTFPPARVGQILEVLQKSLSNTLFTTGCRLRAKGSLDIRGTPLESVALEGELCTGPGRLHTQPVDSIRTNLRLTNSLISFTQACLRIPSGGCYQGDLDLAIHPDRLCLTNRSELVAFAPADPAFPDLGPLTGTLAFSAELPLEGPCTLRALDLQESALAATNLAATLTSLRYRPGRELLATNLTLRLDGQEPLRLDTLHAHLTPQGTLSGLHLQGLAIPQIPRLPASGAATRTLPANPAFPLIVDNLDLLGVHADRLTARLANTPQNLTLDDLMLNWTGTRQIAAGHLIADWPSGLISARLDARIRPETILPLVTNLGLTNLHHHLQPLHLHPDSLLETSCTLNLGFTPENDTLRIQLPLAARTLSYRQVPLDTLTLHLDHNGTRTTLSSLRATRQDTRLQASLQADSDTHCLHFNGATTFPLQDLLQLLYLPRQSLSILDLPAHTRTRAQGTLSTQGPTLPSLQLAAQIDAPTGRIDRIPFVRFAADLAITNSLLTIPSATFQFHTNAAIQATAALRLNQPSAPAPDLPFTLQADISGFPLANLSDYAASEKARRLFGTIGLLSGNLSLSGNLGSTNILATLWGHSNLSVEGGRINRVPLFAGLTDYLAEHLPAVEGLVDQTTAHASMTFENGLVRCMDGDIHGAVFGVRLGGTIDLPSGALNVRARTVFFREQSFWRKISSVVTYPFSKLFMEFRLGGTLDEPTWNYIGLWDRATSR